MAGAQRLTREMLLSMHPEMAHRATIAALRLGAVPAPEGRDPPALATEFAGLSVPNPLGMAAGFDKDAEVAAALCEIGFGFVEAGTVTPRPQPGNPRPRVFRLESAEAVINRLGFNSAGHQAVAERLHGHRTGATIGVNLGANAASDDFVADYVAGVRRFAPLADYLTVNISSPNTPGLRDLQAAEALKRLLGEVLAERARAATRVPVFLKLAPDLEETEMDAIATRRLAQMRLRVGDEMPIIGVGGIYSARSALAKLAAGANALQLYTALVFHGMELIGEIKSGLVRAVRDAEVETSAGLTGTAVDDWASGKAEI